MLDDNGLDVQRHSLCYGSRIARDSAGVHDKRDNFCICQMIPKLIANSRMAGDVYYGKWF